MISTDQIKELRDATGISVMQCKKALEESGGDPEKALALLRKKSKDIALKKSDRKLGAGVVSAYIHGNGSIGSMVVLSCETDFVAQNEEFKKLAYDIAMQVTAHNPEFISADNISKDDKKKAGELFVKEVEEGAGGKPEDVKKKIMEGKLSAYFKERTLLEQDYIKDQSLTVKDLIDSAVQKFGEKIEVAKFTRTSVA